MVVVFKDIIKYKVNDISYSIKENEILLVHPGELHELLYNKVNESSYIVIQFDASFILSLPDFKKHQYWISTFHLLEEKDNTELSKQLLGLSIEIMEMVQRDVQYKDAKICSRLLEIMALIGEYVISDQYILSAVRKSDLALSKIKENIHQSELTQKMIDVCSYLSQNCTNDITLSTAADYAGFSKYHFSRLFSQFTGSSFVEFLINERLKIASDLLLDDNLSITDVAMKSGFSSISTFNRSFQKYRNDTPTNYRKTYKLKKSEE